MSYLREWTGTANLSSLSVSAALSSSFWWPARTFQRSSLVLEDEERRTVLETSGLLKVSLPHSTLYTQKQLLLPQGSLTPILVLSSQAKPRRGSLPALPTMKQHGWNTAGISGLFLDLSNLFEIRNKVWEIEVGWDGKWGSFIISAFLALSGFDCTRVRVNGGYTCILGGGTCIFDLSCIVAAHLRLGAGRGWDFW